MNWEQKLDKLQELKPHLLNMLAPGRWQCSVPGEISDNGLLVSEFGTGTSPSEAVNKAYNMVELLPKNQHIITTGLTLPRKCYRLYNGDWVQVADIHQEVSK